MNSIPQTYKHLELRVVAAQNQTGTSVWEMQLGINPSTGTPQHYALQMYGSSSGSFIGTGSASWGTTYGTLGYMGGTSYYRWGAYTVTIPNYTNTTLWKTWQSIGGYSERGIAPAYVQTVNGFRVSHTDAVTQLAVYNPNGTFAVGTRVSLYGYKGV